MLTLHYIQNKNSSLYFVGIKLGINEIRKGGEFYLFKASLCRYFQKIPGSTLARFRLVIQLNLHENRVDQCRYIANALDFNVFRW